MTENFIKLIENIEIIVFIIHTIDQRFSIIIYKMRRRSDMNTYPFACLRTGRPSLATPSRGSPC